MDTEALARSAVEATFNMKRRIFGEELCDIIGPAFTDGASSGDSISPVVIARNVPCFIQEISGAAAETTVGGESFVSSHRIEMERSTIADAITPQHYIKALPRDGKLARTFEKPVSGEATFSPLVVFKASLVRQGYQQ